MGTPTAHSNAQIGLAAYERYLTPALIFIAALLTRTALSDAQPIYDELYQSLPARDFHQNGTYEILDGVYRRAWLFTQMIAASFALFGDYEFSTARLLPSILPGALLVPVVYVWVKHVFNRPIALITTALVLFWPNGIEVSQYIRFYALQGFCFFTAAVLIYTALHAERIRTAALYLAGAAPLLLLALNLQVITLIGLAGGAVYVAIVFLPGWLRAYPMLWWALGAGALLVVAVLVSGVFADDLHLLYRKYTWEPWPPVDDKTFYHRHFRMDYPTLWTLTPIAAIIALREFPRPALFCIILFGFAFVVHSLGGIKNIRYLYSTMPLLFALWATALYVLWNRGYPYLRDAARGGMASFAAPRLAPVLATGALVASAGFLLLSNPGFDRAAKLAVGSPPHVLLGKTRWHWPEAQRAVRPWLEQDAVVITSLELVAIEWLGDFDISYNRPRFSGTQFQTNGAAQPFDPDLRTGRPIIGLFEDLERVFDCEPVGVFLAAGGWANSITPLQFKTALLERGAEVVIERHGGMALLGWRRTEGPAQLRSASDCGALPSQTGSRAAQRLLSGETQPATPTLGPL